MITSELTILRRSRSQAEDALKARKHHEQEQQQQGYGGPPPDQQQQGGKFW